MMSNSTEAFLAQAADDPRGARDQAHALPHVGVENTLVLRNLIEAAAAGKQVVTLVELTARFDEQANVELAHVLENGVPGGLRGGRPSSRTCKVTLVVRSEADGIRRYVHIEHRETTTRRPPAPTKTSGCSWTRSRPMRRSCSII